MTLHVYVWTPRDGSWGHCSMWIQRARPEDSRYVSWWPLDATNIENLVLCNPAWPNTFSYDVHLEGSNPSREFITNNGSRTYLDEAAMVTAWDRWTAIDCYSPSSRNCCTTVATLLREAGGGIRYQSWEPVTWWGPNDIIQYMRMLNRSFPVVEPLVMTFPPADIPRAPRSRHFRGYEAR